MVNKIGFIRGFSIVSSFHIILGESADTSFGSKFPFAMAIYEYREEG